MCHADIPCELDFFFFSGCGFTRALFCLFVCFLNTVLNLGRASMPSDRIICSVVFSECIHGVRHCSRHLG